MCAARTRTPRSRPSKRQASRPSSPRNRSSTAQWPRGKSPARTRPRATSPRAVQVPDVFRKPEAEAVKALKDAGFDVKVSYAFGSSVLGLVAGQDKTGRQPEGSVITITV